MVKCEEETEHITVSGYVGKPEFARKTRGEQFFFVNNRFIKSGYLHHAVLNAFEGLIARETHPFYVLFIQIDPKHIDVNVHPTTTEIKFDDERTVYGVIRAAVRQSLAAHNVMPSIDFDQDINFGTFTKAEPAISTADKANTQFRNIPRDKNLEHWETIYQDEIKQSKLNFDHDQQDAGPATSPGSPSPHKQEFIPFKEDLFQVSGKYIIAPVNEGVLFVHQQRARERLFYERFVGQLANRSGNAQQCMFPVNLELTPGDFNLVMELQEEIAALGFVFEEFGGNCIVINATPAGLPASDEKALFEGLIEQFKVNKTELSVSKQDNLARAMAKRSSRLKGQGLSKPECKALVEGLFACTQPKYDLDGGKTFFALDLSQIENSFN